MALFSKTRAFAVALALGVACAAVVAGAALAQTMGRTTAQGTIAPGPPLDPAVPAFRTLTAGGPPAARIVRELPRAKAQAGRSRRRRSLAYFAQMSDFQLADEESPARQELNSPLLRSASAWRPHEALLPQVTDYAIRQLDHFTTASPNRGARGRRAAMDFAILTGDQADNQQENETLWVRQLLEGGQTVDPNSGRRDVSDCSLFDKAALAGRPDDEASRYTGVQDYADYNGGSGDSNFYDPNRPTGGFFGGWPRYPGLMDRAQRPFTALGLRRGATPVPTYVANGNHDALIQGNHSADARAEQVATGCSKPFDSNPPKALNAGATFNLGSGFAVPPDERRRLVDRVELKRIYGAGNQSDAHGFDFVDPAQNAASGFSASYYAWDPKPGLRFIALDTVSEGGAVLGSSQGNVDEPQFRWLEAELARARAERKVVVLFGHHPIRMLVSPTPDEVARPCSGRYSAAEGPYAGQADRHGHDRHPGCDLDPRDSSPIHLGGELAELMAANEQVVAYFSGHAHANRVNPCSRCGNWWEVNTTATADWPQQQRLVEIMDNRDGTLSILGTPVDQGAGPAVPPKDTPAAGLTDEQLAGIARVLSYNDPKEPKGASGRTQDRNVELIVKNPYAGPGAGICAMPVRKAGGTRLDRARLGAGRRSLRRAYPPFSLARKTPKLDRFCLLGGGSVRLGYPTRAIEKGLARREVRRMRSRAVLALSSSGDHRLKGVRKGSSVRTARRRLRGERRYRAGRFEWYLAPSSKARIVLKARAGKVVEIGLADRRLTRDKKAIARFLRAFS